MIKKKQNNKFKIFSLKKRQTKYSEKFFTKNWEEYSLTILRFKMESGFKRFYYEFKQIFF